MRGSEGAWWGQTTYAFPTNGPSATATASHKTRYQTAHNTKWGPPCPLPRVTRDCGSLWTQRTCALFHAATGMAPTAAPSKVWDQWRCDSVTALLRDIRGASQALRPDLVLSAAVGAEAGEALKRFQDVAAWRRERLVDAVVPMNYTRCHQTFRFRADSEWRRKPIHVSR